MKRTRRLLVLVLLIAVALATIMAGVRRSGRLTRARGPLSQQAYIWQRNWTPSVREAVHQSAQSFSAYVPLAAEASFKSGRLEFARVEVDYDSLKQTGLPIGLALRIGPYRGPFSGSDRTADQLAQLAASVISDAKAHGLGACEIQIDFDCADSNLDGYAAWIAAIKVRAATTPVTITALPSWLKHSSFARLARASDGYVLQVHSLERPTSADGPMTLCDPAAARRAVETAGQIGVPFRVALPTYGYVVTFDDAGRFAGLWAEGNTGTPPPGSTTRALRADPSQIAGLVGGWANDRPANLIGLIWYRLPIAEDELNWRWTTLRCVMAGASPRSHLIATATRSEPRLYEVELQNDGNAESDLPKSVTLQCPGAVIVACDAIGGFEKTTGDAGMVLTSSPALVAQGIAPGGRRAIGWLRLSQDTEVHAYVASNTP